VRDQIAAGALAMERTVAQSGRCVNQTVGLKPDPQETRRSR